MRDGNGDVAYSGPTVFLPQDQTSGPSGWSRRPTPEPTQIGLEGEFYPTYAFTEETGPFSAFPDAANPAISMLVYTGDLGMDDGSPQSVYALRQDATLDAGARRPTGKPFRLDLQPGQTAQLPDGLGTVSFDGVERWNKIQISHTPGKLVALGGRGPGADRAARLAVHPAAAGLGARPSGGWTHTGRGGRRSTGPAAATSPSCSTDLVAALQARAGTGSQKEKS